MARSQYGLKNTFGPGVIQQQVYNDKAKANKELPVTVVPDEVVAFRDVEAQASLGVKLEHNVVSAVTAGQGAARVIQDGERFELRGPNNRWQHTYRLFSPG